MAKLKFDEVVQCTSCDGTGLYVGMCERDGAAVICHTCKGTGSQRIKLTYNSFEGRQPCESVTRVYLAAGDYVISAKQVKTDAGKVINFQEAGCSYTDWLNGAEPLPIKELHCPLGHFGQGSKVGSLLVSEAGPCSKLLGPGGYIPKCGEEHGTTCWEWLKENPLP